MPSDNIPQTTPPLPLPEELQIETKVQSGEVLFTFSKPVELPFDNEKLCKYIILIMHNKRFLHGHIDFCEPNIESCIHQVLAETLPAYVEKDYSQTKSYFSSKPKDAHFYSLVFQKGKETKGWVEITVHSPEKFLPGFIEGNLVRPTIEKGSILGYVGLGEPSKITRPVKYADVIGMKIMAALLYSQEITLQEDYGSMKRLYRQEINVQVENPTRERIQAALEHTSEIGAFLKEHQETIDKAAQLLFEALILAQDDCSSIKALYTPFLDKYEEIKKKALALGEVESLEGLLHRINTSAAMMLQRVTEQLRPLYSSFPRTILQYVVDKQKENK